MKLYVIFGNSHIHKINGTVFDSNCCAVINCYNHTEGVNKVRELFGTTYCTYYADNAWIEDHIEYFPRGYINVD
jgi:hypothetical protein